MKFFIEGKNIGLRPLSEEDLSLLSLWLNDPEVTRHLFYGRLPMTSGQVGKMFEEYLQSGKNFVFMAVDKKSAKVIGFCGLFDIDWPAAHGEVRILLGERKFWGGTIGMEICAILTHFGFDRLNLNMLYLGTSRSDNRGAVRFFEMIGYKLQGVKREVLYRNGRYYDGTTMDILRSEYYPDIRDSYRDRFGVK